MFSSDRRRAPTPLAYAPYYAAPPKPPMSTMCYVILGVGVLGVASKALAVRREPERLVYLSALALIDAGTLYMMLGYCRKGRTIEGLLKTALLETVLRVAAGLALSDAAATSTAEEAPAEEAEGADEE